MERKERQIAHKVKISEILKGKYIKEGGWTPNHILTVVGKVSRINLIGILIAKTDNEGKVEALIDDGTGKIPIRTFDISTIFDEVMVGDVILIIGRPREYNNEKYLVPEIIKKIDKSWFELRLIELGGVNNNLKKEKKLGGEIKEGEVVNQIIKNKVNSDEVLALIKRLDSGDGADYELLVEKVGDERIITTLLEEGEIFEVTPGKLKSL